MMTVTAQVITGQVYQHHMLGILLGVIAQIFSTLFVGFNVTRSFGRTGNGVDIGLSPLDTTVCLRR